jgi:hypothetical protein
VPLEGLDLEGKRMTFPSPVPLSNLPDFSGGTGIAADMEHAFVIRNDKASLRDPAAQEEFASGCFFHGTEILTAQGDLDHGIFAGRQRDFFHSNG